MSRLLRTTASKRILLVAALTAVTTFGLATTTAEPAWAQPAPAQPSEKEKERARELMAQGRELRDKNDLTGAIKSFQGAHDIMHVTTTAYELAKTQQLANLLVEAHETIVMLRAIPSTPSDPEPFKEARVKADALDKEILEKMPALKISVTSSDPKITPTITVDNQPASTDAPRKVNPGKHVVVAKGGGAEASSEVSVNPGETKAVDLRLETKSSIAVSTPTETKKGPVPLVSWIGFGVGAAGLVVGSITGVMAFSQKSDIDAKCPDKKCKEENRADLDSANDIAMISNVGFIVAGVGAAVGVVGLLFLRHDEEPPPATGFGWKNVHFAGNGLRGTF